MTPAWRFAIGACCGALCAAAVVMLFDDSMTTSAGDSISHMATPVRPADGGNAESSSNPDAATSTAPNPGAPAVPSLSAEDANAALTDALTQALALERGVLRTIALLDAASAWARRDPIAAIERAATLPPDERAKFTTALAQEWAFIDPSGFFAYAESAGSIDPLVAGLRLLIATDPEHVFGIASRHLTAGRTSVDTLYLAAVRGMTSRDPSNAMARVQSAAVGRMRDPILTSIAEAYAALDASAALEWALSLEPPSAASVVKIAETVAAEDLLRAHDLLIGIDTSRFDSFSPINALANAAVREGRESPRAIADWLARSTDPAKARLLTRVMTAWALEDARGAAAWLAANEAHVTEDMVNALASRLAFDHVRLAAEWLDLVPERFQQKWLSEVAFRYGQFAVVEALTWIDRYAGRPGHSDALGRLLGGALNDTPERLAALIEAGSVSADDNLVETTAGALARRNPQRALRWALRLRDREHSDRAAEAVTSQWMVSDAAAAQRWVLDQPRGQGRDRLLDRAVMAGITYRSLDEAADLDALVSAYASDTAMQRTVASFIERAVRTPARERAGWVREAQRLLEHLSDPELRRQAEQQIAAASQR